MQFDSIYIYCISLDYRNTRNVDNFKVYYLSFLKLKSFVFFSYNGEENDQYIMLGTNDLDKAVNFFDIILHPLGLHRVELDRDYAGYAEKGDQR